MSNRTWCVCWLAVAAIALMCVAAPPAAADDKDAKDEAKAHVLGKIVIVGPDGQIKATGPGSIDVDVDVAKAAALSDYWIGVVCGNVDAALRAQLSLAEDQGILVAGVSPSGPAAKAGIKQYDVLTEADGKKVGSIDELVKAVDRAKDKKSVSLTVLSGGKKKTVKVQPVKRPAAAKHLPWDPKVMGKDREAIKKWMEKMGPGHFGGKLPFEKDFHFEVIRPGVVVKSFGKLPNDLQVTIHRHGDKPAQITVKKGDKTWNVTEKELDKLPEDVRGHVKGLLGGGFPFGGRMMFGPGNPPKGGAGGIHFGPVLPEQLEKLIPKEHRLRPRRDIDELERRLERIEKMLEELKKEK